MTVHGGLVGVIPTTVASVSVYPHLRIFANVHTCVYASVCARADGNGTGRGKGGKRRQTGACGCTWIDTRCDRVRV